MGTTKKILIGATLGVTLLGATGAVLAHGSWRGEGRHAFGPRHGHGMATGMLERFDADKDGAVTRAEVDAKRDGSLKKYDSDASASLSLQEFEGLWAEMTRPGMVRAFQRLDRDGDGQVTKDEIDRPLTFMFGRLDRNGDGTVSKEEMTRRFKGHRHGRRDRDDDHRGRGERR